MLTKEMTLSGFLMSLPDETTGSIRKFADDNKIDFNIMAKADEINKNKKYKKSVVGVVIAVTDWEHFGPNDNSDAFPVKAFGNITNLMSGLSERYKTFISNGNVYLFHQSSDAKKAIGTIHYGWYNAAQGRVELIVEIEWDKATSECMKLRKGEALNVSMGCKLGVPDDKGNMKGADYCSYCGKRATSPKEHCEHIQYKLGQIIDGVPVFMINVDEIFFDLSRVIIPGDPAARFAYVAPDNNTDEA